jgi:hypothetical protein
VRDTVRDCLEKDPSDRWETDATKAAFFAS